MFSAHHELALRPVCTFRMMVFIVTVPFHLKQKCLTLYMTHNFYPLNFIPAKCVEKWFGKMLACRNKINKSDHPQWHYIDDDDGDNFYDTNLYYTKNETNKKGSCFIGEKMQQQLSVLAVRIRRENKRIGSESKETETVQIPQISHKYNTYNKKKNCAVKRLHTNGSMSFSTMQFIFW